MQITIQNFKIQDALDSMTVREFHQFRTYTRKLLKWSSGKWFNKLHDITPLNEAEKIVLFKIYEQKEYLPTKSDK